MISLYGVQEMHLLLRCHADLPSVRRIFSCSAVGRREVRGAASHTAHCQVLQMFLSSCWTRLGHPLLLCICKMSHRRKGNASLSRLRLQSIRCFQMKANDVINCMPFSFRTPIFRHLKVLMPAKRRQVQVCVDMLFLLGFCPLHLMGVCNEWNAW